MFNGTLPHRQTKNVIPAKAGIQAVFGVFWTPACAGVTIYLSHHLSKHQSVTGKTPAVIAKERSDCGNLTAFRMVEIATPPFGRLAMTAR
jgi:hypothetical protein